MKPAPALMTLAIEPKSRADQARLVVALRELEAADRGFEVHIDNESRQIILGGADEVHLQTKIEALRHDHRLDINFGGPQIAYLETIAQQVETDFTVTQIAGQRTFARLKLSLAPRDRGQGNVFVSTMARGALPEAYVAAIGHGVDSVLSSGVMAGFPVADIAATLLDAACHDQDSSPAAFETAARSAMREGLQKGGLVLLEPIMALEIRVPGGAVDPVLLDLRQRGAVMRGQETSGAVMIIGATAPLARLIGYLDVVRSLSDGHAICAMQLSHHAAVSSPESDGPYPATAALRMPAILALGGTA